MTATEQIVTCARCGHQAGGCPRCGRNDETIGYEVEGAMYCHVQGNNPILPVCVMEAEWEVEDRPELERERRDQRRVEMILRRNQRITELHRKAAEATPGQLGEIVALHAPTWENVKIYPYNFGNEPQCAGCSVGLGGYPGEYDPPSWPCRTYKIATRHLKSTDNHQGP